MDNAAALETSYSSPDAGVAVASNGNGSNSGAQSNQRLNRTDRPCDTCRRRKSKCVKEASQDRCVLCTFHDRECTFKESPQQRGKKRHTEVQDDSADGETARRPRQASRVTPSPVADVAPSGSSTRPAITTRKSKSLLDRTLGLHPTAHYKYVGPSSMHEERLFDLIQSEQDLGSDDERGKFRRVAEDTTFHSRSDTRTLFNEDVDSDQDAIEKIVGKHGHALVALYFRTVQPSYPILHREAFWEKYNRSYKEFSPPLMAAVYLLAMNWWEYDQELSTYEKPDSEALLRIAMKTMMGAVLRPKLSSAQAGLLLLQISGGDSWVLTSQIVAVAEELGLHLDCSSWSIPDWEKGLRRRLSWAIYMQDKWGALIHGRPSHAMAAHWQIPWLTLEDFPESAADESNKEGSTEVEQGRLRFIYLSRLTQIMAQALEALYGPDPSRAQLFAAHGIQGLLELVKPFAVQLKDWVAGMPPCLRMEDVKTRKLCSNGFLHLARWTTEIVIYRAIIRSLSPTDPPQLWQVCRKAGSDRLLGAIDFVDNLRPEHLQAFWWFASSKSLAFIMTYGGLLWSTSTTDEEEEFYRSKLDKFSWTLKLLSKGVGFVNVALREMQDSLQGLDMKRSLPGRGLREAATSIQNGDRGPEFPSHRLTHHRGSTHADVPDLQNQGVMAVAAYDDNTLPDDGDAYAYLAQPVAHLDGMHSADFDSAALADFSLHSGEEENFFFQDFS